MSFESCRVYIGGRGNCARPVGHLGDHMLGDELRLLEQSGEIVKLREQRDTAWRALEDVFKGAGETWRSKPPDARPWWFRSVEGALGRLPLPTTVVDAPKTREQQWLESGDTAAEFERKNPASTSCCVECRRVVGDGPGSSACAYGGACACHMRGDL